MGRATRPRRRLSRREPGRCPGVRDRTRGALDGRHRRRAGRDVACPRTGDDRRGAAGTQPTRRLRPARRRGDDGGRGLPPRRGVTARGGRRPDAGGRAGARCDGGRDAGAVQPPRPYAGLRDQPWWRRGSAAWSSPRPTPTRSPPGAATPSAPPASRWWRACSPRRLVRSTGSGRSRWSISARSSPGSSRPPSTGAAPPPTAPAGGCPRGPPGSTPIGCARSATRCWSAPTRSRSTTPR